MGFITRAIAGVGLLLLLGVAAVMSDEKPAQRTTVASQVLVVPDTDTKKDEVHLDETILAKAAKEPVKSRFSPVFVYQVDDNAGGKFIASGVYVNSSDHGEVLITCEHLFPKDRADAPYAVLRVLPMRKDDVLGIVGVVAHGAEFPVTEGDKPDVVMLKLGGKPQTLSGFHEFPLRSHTRGKIRMVKAKFQLTSLLSGQQVNIVGQVKGGHDDPDTCYFLVESDAINGESGSGFVDPNDKLYILCAGIELTGADLAGVQKDLGTTKSLRMVYGPLNIE